MVTHLHDFNRDAVAETEDLESLEYLRGQIELIADTVLYTTEVDGLRDMDSMKGVFYSAFESTGNRATFVATVVDAFFAQGDHHG